jgi:hypothetical protein
MRHGYSKWIQTKDIITQTGPKGKPGEEDEFHLEPSEPHYENRSWVKHRFDILEMIIYEFTLKENEGKVMLQRCWPWTLLKMR